MSVQRRSACIWWCEESRGFNEELTYIFSVFLKIVYSKGTYEHSFELFSVFLNASLQGFFFYFNFFLYECPQNFLWVKYFCLRLIWSEIFSSRNFRIFLFRFCGFNFLLLSIFNPMSFPCNFLIFLRLRIFYSFVFFFVCFHRPI